VSRQPTNGGLEAICPTTRRRLDLAARQILIAKIVAHNQHSIVTGAFKFDKKYNQVLPSRLLDAFKSNINSLSTLVTIGYSFGDSHINSIIRDWAEMDQRYRIVIVDPNRGIPSVLLHVAPQVDLRKVRARDFFELAHRDGFEIRERSQ
jgi:hypothetical protein